MNGILFGSGKVRAKLRELARWRIRTYGNGFDCFGPDYRQAGILADAVIANFGFGHRRIIAAEKFFLGDP